MPTDPRIDEILDSQQDFEKYKDYLISREALGKKVSKDSLTHFNQIGYFGIYQMGVQALESVGYLKPGSYDRYRRSRKSQEDFMKDDSNWEGGRSLEWFSNEDKQTNALKALTKQNLTVLKRTLSNAGIEDPNEVLGYLAAAHLGGAGTVKNMIKTGKTAFKDANNTSPHSYVEGFLEYVGYDKPRSGRREAPGISKEFKNSFKLSDNTAIGNQMREYVDIKNTMSNIMGNFDTSLSGLSDVGQEKLETSIRRTVEGTAKYDTDYNRIASKIKEYANFNNLLEGATKAPKEIPAEEAIPQVTPPVTPPSNEFSIGGYLQPNGRTSQFKRAEDLTAQNNTLNIDR